MNAKWTHNLVTAASLGLVSFGCGAMPASTFPNQLVGAQGQRFTVEDLESIANDPDLDTDGKREAFRALGIEDERLIDALLGL